MPAADLIGVRPGQDVILPTLLSGGLAQAVIDAWRPFAAHSDGCSQCEMAILELKRVPDDPFPYYDWCCGAGQDHFAIWTDAKIALTARLKEVTTPWGMAGLVGDEADERSDAIVSMPGPAAAELFREPDAERREAVIRALIAAHRLDTLRTSPADAREHRQCAADDCTTGPYGSHGSFVVSPRFPRQRYCCDACRKRSERRDRPRLMSTEE